MNLPALVCWCRRPFVELTRCHNDDDEREMLTVDWDEAAAADDYVTVELTFIVA